MAVTGNARTLGGPLRDLRRANGLSQEALARRADCSTKMVALLEGGYLPGRSAVLVRIASALSKTNGPVTTEPFEKERDDAAPASG